MATPPITPPSVYTINNIIGYALQSLGVTGANQTTNGADYALGLYKAQQILDANNIDGTLLYGMVTKTCPIKAQKAVYTIGPQVPIPGVIQYFDSTTLESDTGFTPGTFVNQSLYGGSGSGATATIVADACNDGQVISFTLTNGGECYEPGDVLSWTQSIGGQVSPTASIAIGYDPQDVIEATDFVVNTRPQNIEFASFQPSGVAPAIDVPLKILNAREWAAIVSKQIGSGIPAYLYLDNTYPQGKIYLWNQPNTGGNLVLTYWELLPSWSITGSTVIQNTFPPGFTRLLELEIAAALAPSFNREDKLPGLAADIADLKRKMHVNNTTSEWAVYDVPTGSLVYDARSGTTWR